MANCHGVTSQLAWEMGKRVGNSPRSRPPPSPPPVPPVSLPGSCFWGANQVPKPMPRINCEVPGWPTPRSAAPVWWGQTLAARKAPSSLRKGAGSSRWHGDVSSAVVGRRQRGDGPGGSAGNGVPGTCCIPWAPQGLVAQLLGNPCDELARWHTSPCVFTKDGDAHSS